MTDAIASGMPWTRGARTIADSYRCPHCSARPTVGLTVRVDHRENYPRRALLVRLRERAAS